MNGPGPGADNQGPGPQGVRVPIPHQPLDRAREGVSALARSFSQQIHDRLWQAAQFVEGCAAKRQAMAQKLLTEVNGTLDKFGNRFQFDIYSALGAAAELASQLGCELPTEAEVREHALSLAGPPSPVQLPPVYRPQIVGPPPRVGMSREVMTTSGMLPDMPTPPIYPSFVTAGFPPLIGGGVVRPEVAVDTLPPTISPYAPIETPYVPPQPAAPTPIRPAPIGGPVNPPRQQGPLADPTAIDMLPTDAVPVIGPGEGKPQEPVAPAPDIGYKCPPPPCIPICPPSAGPTVPTGTMPPGGVPQPGPAPGGPIGPGLPPFNPVIPGPAPPGQPAPAPQPPFGFPPFAPIGVPGPFPPQPIPPGQETVVLVVPPPSVAITVIGLPGGGGTVVTTPVAVDPGGTPTEPIVVRPPVIAPPAPPETVEHETTCNPFNLPPFRFSTAQDCSRWAEWMQSVSNLVGGTGERDDEGNCRSVFGWKQSELEAILQRTPSGWQRDLSRLAIGSAYWLSQAIYPILTGFGACGNSTIAPAKILELFVGLGQRWLGSAFDIPASQVRKATNYACPTEIPGQGEVNDLFVRGLIDEPLWTCWTSLHGNIPGPASEVRNVGFWRPSIPESIALYRRRETSYDRLVSLLRYQGVRSRDDVDALLAIDTYVPGIQDIISWMVRDVFDENVVAKYGYDEEFDEKFDDVAQRLAEANGADPETFRLHWRAHWRLPAIGNAYDMLHRLRPGRVDAGLVFTREDMQELLAVEDIPRHWRDRLIAINHLQIQKVDLRIGYFNGSISDDELYEQLLDKGYNERDANISRNIFRAQRLRFYSNRPIARRFIAGEVTEQEARDVYQAEGISAGAFEQLIEYLRNLRSLRRRGLCVKAIRKRFLVGELEYADAVRELVLAGVAQALAIDEAQAWTCERAAHGKQVPAAQLCKWAEKGLISLPDMRKRLKALGYSDLDADRVVVLCNLDVQERAAAMVEKKRRAEEQAALREKRRMQGEAKAAAQARAAHARSVAAANKQRERERIALSELATLIETVSGRSRDESESLASAATYALAATGTFSVIGATKLLEDFVKGLKAQKRKGVADAIEELLNEYQTSIEGIVGAGESPAPSGNGEAGQ